ncbi:hypothetical protein BgiBS90_005162 [Biomphalaria glabrata]|nr:hypothetical protein BgiBS90_005162 [Biomphalaria glabrata]
MIDVSSLSSHSITAFKSSSLLSLLYIIYPRDYNVRKRFLIFFYLKKIRDAIGHHDLCKNGKSGDESVRYIVQFKNKRKQEIMESQDIKEKTKVHAGKVQQNSRELRKLSSSGTLVMVELEIL